MTSRHVLLIGGAGYVGTAITPCLLDHGYRVTCLDNFLMGSQPAVAGFLLHDRYRLIAGDMAVSADLDQALDGVTDVVLLAGLVGDALTKQYPEQAHAVNVVATKSCLTALNGRGLQRVIFVSSCSNYGVCQQEPACETAPLLPTSLYAQNKIEIEQYIMQLRDQVDYAPVILRFATAFGLSPRTRLDLTINEFVYQAARFGELVLYNPGAWRPYCHVQDFARLIDQVLQAKADQVSFEIFNAGGDINNSTKQNIVNTIQEYLPHMVVKCWEHVVDPRDYRVDFTKVRQVLCFEPQHTIRHGIEEMLTAVENSMFDLAESMPRFYHNRDLSAG